MARLFIDERKLREIGVDEATMRTFRTLCEFINLTQTVETQAGAISDAEEAIAALDGTKQPLSNELTGLDALAATVGLLEQTADNVFGIRLLGVGATTSVPTRSDADGRYVQQNGASKPVYSAYAGQTVSAGYVQAEAQATDDAVKAASIALAAVITALDTANVLS